LGTRLRADGSLTESQREHADACGIPHDVFRQQLIDRLMEQRGGLVPTTRPDFMKKDAVYADNPVMIIGGGPSARMNIELVKKFPCKKILVEIMLNEFGKLGLKPDYVATLEESNRIINPALFDPIYLKGTIVIGSYITRPNIANHATKYGGFRRFKFEEEARASNCGIFAINYAYRELKADKIILIGMEHTGVKYPPAVYHTWQVDFWHFAKQWPKETFVNCSGGLLYHEDYIIDTTLDKLIVKPRDNNPG
jgi:hypothetical protein